ncbi:MAG: TetR/AcrR family transcriptional regulator [Hymenobacteraceae bacterium]|nr:TetR/AcrR family transcriptional regulator [Hymenobacteraceae bacterium]
MNKEQIIAASLEAFNEKGLTGASLRAIASRLGISDGHLRYYFKTREDLVLATFEAMDADILSRSKAPAADGFSWRFMLDELTGTFLVMYDYRCFFLESPVRLKELKKVHAAYQQLMGSRRELFLQLFKGLQQLHIFDSRYSDGDFDSLFEQFFILSDSWVKQAYLHPAHNAIDQTAAHYARLSLLLFLPFVKEPHKQQLLDLKDL